MFYDSISLIKSRVISSLDDSFRPAVLWNHAFLDAVRNSKKRIPLSIVIEKGDSSASIYKTQVFSPESKFASLNYFYVEKLIKTLLWIHGGYKIFVGGPKEIGEHIKKLYSQKGKRFFDANSMSNIYEKPFSIVACSAERVLPVKEKSIPLNRQFKGCRIGFDLGASDRKVSAVIDDKVVFSEEVVWNPSVQTNPNYHYHEIMSMLHRAAAHMPCVDAIGGSSAGVYINNRVMAASIFCGVSPDLFEKRVKNIFLDIQKEWDVPFKVINDGEVTALAGSISLKVNSILGIAMGSSEAGGYIDKKGNITTRLNELAFVPIDFNNQSPVDPWSKDHGCGVQYFSQVAVIRLAKIAGIALDEKQTSAEKLKFVQKLLAKGNSKAIKIFETIGVYLGYAIAHYADFYDLEHILILGRVTSGKSGHIILKKAEQVLKEEFPELFKNISLHLPDESIRRVGQSIAAASLPILPQIILTQEAESKMINKNKRTIIINGTIITPFKLINGKAIIVEKGKIIEIVNKEELNTATLVGAEVIEAKDKFVVPGYINIHVHGGGGSDVMDGKYEAIKQIAITHSRFGTTAFLPTTMTMNKNKIIRSLKTIYEAKLKGTGGAEILGVNLEGPYINPEKKGAQREIDIRKPSIKEFSELNKASGNMIRLVTVAPEMPGAIELIKYLCKQGIIASVGHSNATYAQTQAGIEAGLSHVTHTFNAMRGLHHREPGVVGAALTSPKLTVEIIADGIHVHPVVIKMLIQAKESEKIVLITDSMKATGIKGGIYDLGGQEVTVNKGQARLKDGTLAGSLLTMDKAVKNMVSKVGLLLPKAIQMASLNPAKSIGIDDKKGSLEPGKDADIIILNKNLETELTIVAGKVVYRRR